MCQRSMFMIMLSSTCIIPSDNYAIVFIIVFYTTDDDIIVFTIVYYTTDDDVIVITIVK